MKSRQFNVRHELAEFSRYVINSKEICYLIFDVDGYLIAANEAAKILYTEVYSSNIIEGIHISEFKPKEIAHFVAELMQKCKLGESAEFKGEYIRKSNQNIVFVFCKFTPVFDEERQIRYYLGTITDITEAKNTENSLFAAEANLLAVLDSGKDQFILCDNKLNVVVFNKLAAKYIEKSKNLIIEKGKSILDFVNEPDKASFERFIRTALGGKTLTAERKLISPRNNEAWIEITSSPIRNQYNEITNALISYTNITERKKNEIALRQSESNLNIIFNSGTQGFVLVDKECKCLIYNSDAERFFAKYFGIELRRGALISNKMNFDLSKHLVRNIKVSQNGGRIYTEDEFKEGNTTKYFSIQFDPVKTDVEKRVTIWIVDITGRKKAENSLRLSERNLQAVFNNSNQTFYLLNTKYIIENINNAAQKETLEQYGKAAQIGDSVFDFIDPANHSLAQSNFDRALKGKSTVEEDFVNSEEQIKWFERHYNPIKDANGNVEQITVWSIDISERKKIETALINSEKKFKKLSTLSPIGIYQTDENNQIIFINKSLEKILGLKPNAIMEEKWATLICADDLERVQQKIQTAFENHTEYIAEYRLKQNISSKTISVLEHAVPLFEDSIHFIGFLGTIVDITEHIEKQKYKTEKEMVEKSLKFKSDFLAGMSHEIRTPLTTILGYAELMSESTIKPEQRDYINIILNAAKNLQSIVNDILDLSKLEAGKLDLKKEIFNAEDLVVDAIKAFSLLAKDRKIKLKYEYSSVKDIYLNADKRRLHQILGNLIKNAIIYNTINGKVEVNINIENDFEDSILLKVEVIDTGVGIKNEDIPKLFSEYSQLQTVRTDFEGTGLGLILSKKMVEMFGGEMNVESKYGIGSRFWFTFFADKVSNKNIETNTQNIQLPHCTILLAEDNAINRMAFVRMLMKLGMTVIQAQNGNEVLEKCENEKFDLIIMDLQMPEMDGIMAISALKEKYNNLPPIIGLSGNISHNMNNDYLKYGMVDFLSKPIISKDFEQIISKWGKIRS